MRILSAADVRACLPMPEAIDAMREAFAALSSGRVRSPLRAHLETAGGTMLYMPAYIDGSPISTVKVVSVFPDNPAARGLPTVQAMVVVVSAETGATLALMDGTTLTAIRTGAASGLATDLLARRDAAVLGVIGAGAQARTQVEAVLSIRPIHAIRVYSLRGANAFADELRARTGLTVDAVNTASEVARGADVVVTATNSATPVLALADVSPSVHVNGVGSYTPRMQELAADLVCSATLVVDHRESAWAEAGDLIIPRDAGLLREDDVRAELGELVLGRKPGRESDDEITVFKSVGNAAQDAAAARRVLVAAEARGMGIVV